jgi:hypothetical protein
VRDIWTDLTGRPRREPYSTCKARNAIRSRAPSLTSPYGAHRTEELSDPSRANPSTCTFFGRPVTGCAASFSVVPDGWESGKPRDISSGGFAAPGRGSVQCHQDPRHVSAAKALCAGCAKDRLAGGGTGQGDVLVAGQAQGERQVLAQQVDRESDRLVSRCQECISLGAYGYPLAIKALHFVSVGG